MDTEILIAHGNQAREDNNPEQALMYYASAFVQDRNNFNAFNNYGNVLRELGDPAGAIPFLQRAIQLNPTNPVPHFNLAVSLLLLGNYQQGWPAYEVRWQYEHLAGTLPQLPKPRWTGQDLNGKTILVLGEQGHGDTIQFVRFVQQLCDQGAEVIVQSNSSLKELFINSLNIKEICSFEETPGEYDYWSPMMSLPNYLNITLENLTHRQFYLVADSKSTQLWQQHLGPKTKLRIGFSWSGRRDTWMNRHKGMPFEHMLNFIKAHPQYEWINLQVDCTEEENQQLVNAGVRCYPGMINSFADTAALITHLDVVLSVDTAIAHLAGALGRPTWVMLAQYMVDWRWLLKRDDSPWYATARLFRQTNMGNWKSVTDKISRYLDWFKI